MAEKATRRYAKSPKVAPKATASTGKVTEDEPKKETPGAAPEASSEAGTAGVPTTQERHKSELGEIHKRHNTEMSDMHSRHAKEHSDMMKRHLADAGPDGGEEEPSEGGGEKKVSQDDAGKPEKKD